MLGTHWNYYLHEYKDTQRYMFDNKFLKGRECQNKLCSMPFQACHQKPLQKSYIKNNKNRKPNQTPVLLAFLCKIHNESSQEKAVRGKITSLGFPNPSNLPLHNQNVAQNHIKCHKRGEKYYQRNTWVTESNSQSILSKIKQKDGAKSGIFSRNIKPEESVGRLCVLMHVCEL